MADVINRTTLEFLKSQHTPDFPVADWIINPDLSALSGVPAKYWKIVADTVVEMTQTEKDAVDAAAAVAATAAAAALNADMTDALQVRNTAADAASLPVPPPRSGAVVSVQDVGAGLPGIAVSNDVGWLLFAKTGEI